MISQYYLIFVILLNTLCVLSLKFLHINEKKFVLRKCVKYIVAFGVGIAVSFLCTPLSAINGIVFGLSGSLTIEMLELLYIAIKSALKKETLKAYYDDGSPRKFYITGDKHRNFSRVREFCKDIQTRRKDVLIILGDAGFNFYGDERDSKLKAEVSSFNITLFCIHGNKENRPQNIGTYGICSFCGGKVYYEPQYPNILFAIDGEIYTFEGKKYMVVGGAHSVDKMRCISDNLPYWEDEMPDDCVKSKVEERLKSENNSIYGMLTHTCPIEYLPTEVFISTKQNFNNKRKKCWRRNKQAFVPDIDRTTEMWLEEIEKRIDYKVWYCGHYHVTKQIDKIQMLYHTIRPLHLNGDDNAAD